VCDTIMDKPFDIRGFKEMGSPLMQLPCLFDVVVADAPEVLRRLVHSVHVSNGFVYMDVYENEDGVVWKTFSGEENPTTIKYFNFSINLYKRDGTLIRSTPYENYKASISYNLNWGDVSDMLQYQIVFSK
jgi:hypothetical protein